MVYRHNTLNFERPLTSLRCFVGVHWWWQFDFNNHHFNNFHNSHSNNDISVQFSSGAQSCPTLCDPMDHSMPGLPVHHQLLEFTQMHVRWHLSLLNLSNLVYVLILYTSIYHSGDFPRGAVVRNLPANARDVRDMGLIPGWGRAPGEGYSNPLQYSYLENPMVREAWQATVLMVQKSRTWLKQFSTHTLRVIWKHSNHFNFTGCNLNWVGGWSIIPHNDYSEPYLGPIYSWPLNNRGLNCASPFIGVCFFFFNGKYYWTTQSVTSWIQGWETIKRE